MIYAVNKRTKEHRKIDSSTQLPWTDWRFQDATPDGWIPWHGGECPLPDAQLCETMSRSGQVAGPMPADADVWEHVGRSFDIIAYRPILKDQATLAGAKLWQDAEGTIPAYEGDPVGYFVPPMEFDGVHDYVDFIKKPEPPAWDGESWPPPIGSVVESFAHLDDGAQAEVLAVRQGNVIGCHVESGIAGWLLKGQCRPIRSAEDRAVEAMLGDVEAQGDTMEIVDNADFCRALYRAGYRKVDS